MKRMIPGSKILFAALLCTSGKVSGGKEVFSKITVTSEDGKVIGWGFKE